MDPISSPSEHDVMADDCGQSGSQGLAIY